MPYAAQNYYVQCIITVFQINNSRFIEAVHFKSLNEKINMVIGERKFFTAKKKFITKIIKSHSCLPKKKKSTDLTFFKNISR